MARKVTFKLSETVIDDLKAVSHGLGIPQSVVVEYLLTESCPMLLTIIDRLPDRFSSDGDIRRMRGDSIAVINEKLSELRVAVSAIEESHDAH